MSNYVGVKCPVCSKKFAQGDDVVVCPVCGAPHHRGCYAENGECVFASEHMSGKEWRPPSGMDASEEASSNQNRPGVTLCPACDSANPKGAFFCQICGRRLNVVPNEAQNRAEQQSGNWGFPGFGGALDPVSLMYGGVSPDDEIEGETARDMAVYIGEGSSYYLPRFKVMSDTSRTLSFNFFSLIFGFFYFFHRKMYLFGAILAAFSVIGMIPSFFEARESIVLMFVDFQTRGLLPPILAGIDYGKIPVDYAMIEHYRSLSNVAGTINFMISLLVSLCANKLYQLKAVADVRKIRENRAVPPDESSYNNELASKGGTSKTAVFVAIGIASAVYIAVCAVISYQFMGGLGL